jgi:hypothetical protein
VCHAVQRVVLQERPVRASDKAARPRGLPESTSRQRGRAHTRGLLGPTRLITRRIGSLISYCYFSTATMSDNQLVAQARAELVACLPKTRAEECVLEAIGDVINPPGSDNPSAGSLDQLIEALPPESLVTVETIRYSKIWTTLRSTLRCLEVEVASARGRTVALCAIKSSVLRRGTSRNVR